MKDNPSSKIRATILDVARQAEVSTKSISRVLNGEPGVSAETRQRIQTVIEQLGYVPNSAARRMRGTSKAVGLITSGFEDYAGQVIRGMSKAAQHMGYNLVLYVQFAASARYEPYQKFIGSGLIDGILMVVPEDYDILTKLCNDHDLPYVLIDYEGSKPAEDTFVLNVTNRKGMLEATRYLLALGHRRIGFITGVMTFASARERLQGYRDALSEAGIPYDPSLVVEGQWTQESGFTQAHILLERDPQLTAIVASDDLTAFGVMDAIKDAGLRVAEDVSVIGFDDIPMATSVYPPLTTVRQPMIEMGQAAIELLVALLENRPPLSLERDFATDLIIRESTGRPKVLRPE